VVVVGGTVRTDPGPCIATLKLEPVTVKLEPVTVKLAEPIGIRPVIDVLSGTPLLLSAR
jgi:hypothetical protein